MTQIVVADVGGTHARFALADVAGGRVVSLGDPVKLRAADYAGLPEAWRAFCTLNPGAEPRHGAFALAGPVRDGEVRFTNSHWVVNLDTLEQALAIDSFLAMNDFAAVAHAVDSLESGHFEAVCGPAAPLPCIGTVSVLGLGTGLGVAAFQRGPNGSAVLATEGAHIAFAPLDDSERRIAEAFAAQYGRVSVERLVSGPGLGAIVRCLAPGDARGDADLWQAAIDGGDEVADNALDVLLAAFGSFAGDAALIHGANAVVLTGGLVNRLGPRLAASRFHTRFCDKGRYRAMMEAIPTLRLTHPEPGLYGAAAAFARDQTAA